MYLVTFLILILSIIGVYAQTLSVQAARIYANQAGFAHTVLAWHYSAAEQARFAGINNGNTNTGCSLTSSLITPAICTSSVAGNPDITVDGTQPGALTACSTTPTAPCWTGLPPGYNKSPYTFNSVYYTVQQGQTYVVTYVLKPTISATNPAPGFITLPDAGGTQIGFTIDELAKQLKHTNLPVYSYGTVKGGVLQTAAIANTGTLANIQPTLPKDAFGNSLIPDGAVAIVSVP